MKTGPGKAFLALTLSLSATALWAQQDEAPVFMTGAEPISETDYAALPKQRRFRAWLPKKVDLSPSYPPPGTQGPQPNCVAWATTYAARSFLYGKDLGRQPTHANEQMSPAYVYNRLRPPGSPCNSTIRIVDALNLLQSEGVVTLADFPDDLSKCAIPAPVALRDKAGQMKLAYWRAIDRETPNDWRTPVVLDDIKGALARGAPVIFAMPATRDFMALKGDAVFTRDVREMRNYHAMALVGYDEDRQAVRLMNSWGRGWGDGGYAWVAYDTFKLLAGEAYALDAPPPAVKPAAPAPVQTPQQAFDALAAKLPCGAVTVGRSGGRPTISGFAGSQGDIDALRAAAIAVDPRTVWQVAHHPWPQCEAELTLAQALKVGGVSIAAQTEQGQPRNGDPVSMKAGDRFGVVAEASAARPYLSIIYLQADGSAVELYRGKPEPDARQRRSVGIGTGGPTQVRFEVAPPFGDEIMIAIASAQPLFGAELDSYATERQFLTGLRAKLARTAPGSVSAAVLRLRTKG